MNGDGSLGQHLANHWPDVGPWIGTVLSLLVSLAVIVRSRVVAEATVKKSMAATIEQLHETVAQLLQRLQSERADAAATIERVRAEASRTIGVLSARCDALARELAEVRESIKNAGVDVSRSMPPAAIEEPTVATRREHSQRFNVPPKGRGKP